MKGQPQLERSSRQGPGALEDGRDVGLALSWPADDGSLELEQTLLNRGWSHPSDWLWRTTYHFSQLLGYRKNNSTPISQVEGRAERRCQEARSQPRGLPGQPCSHLGRRCHCGEHRRRTLSACSQAGWSAGASAGFLGGGHQQTVLQEPLAVTTANDHDYFR